MLNTQTFIKQIKKQGSIARGDTIVAAVSGGGDSVCMLHLLWKVQEALAIRLLVVHIHHGIRGEEADRDRDFCKALAKSLSLPFYCFHRDVPAFAKAQGLGEEEAGRVLRYACLQEIAREVPCHRGKIALAHHKEDNAETILHNLLRGSGLAGLQGIPKSKDNVIRPLLDFSREEIEAYLTENNIAYQRDSTNLENHYTRNRIRNQIFPLFTREINSRAVDHILRAGKIFGEAHACFKALARKEMEEEARKQEVLSSALLQEGEEEILAAFSLERLRCMEHILGMYVLEALFAKAYGARGEGLKDLAWEHREDVYSLLFKDTGKEIALPRGLRAKRGYGFLLLLPEKEGGRKEFRGENVTFHLLEQGDFSRIPKERERKWLDADKVVQSIVQYRKGEQQEKNLLSLLKEAIAIRHRCTGDYISIRGGRKSLKKLLIDDKIPAALRDRMLVAAIGPEVLWTEWGRISAYHRVQEGTTKILEICLETK